VILYLRIIWLLSLGAFVTSPSGYTACLPPRLAHSDNAACSDEYESYTSSLRSSFSTSSYFFPSSFLGSDILLNVLFSNILYASNGKISSAESYGLTNLIKRILRNVYTQWYLGVWGADLHSKLLLRGEVDTSSLRHLSSQATHIMQNNTLNCVII
jgi:hypothetical protein